MKDRFTGLNMSYFDRIDSRTRDMEVAWAERYGPWNRRGEWPPHPKPPCYYCWSAERVRVDAVDIDRIPRATTFIDRYEGRYTVCEPHFVKGLREIGHSDVEIREFFAATEYSREEIDAFMQVKDE